MKRFHTLALGLCMAAMATDAPDISGPDVINHLNRTIAWYEHVSSATRTMDAPQSVLLEDNVRQSSKQVVQRAFAFARAEAAILANQKPAQASGGTPAPAQGQARTLEQAAAAANERIQRLEIAIADVNQQIAKAPRRKLATLVSRRNTLTADLGFAKAAQSGLRDLLQFASSSDKSGGLIGQINLLANSDSIPTALSDTARPLAATTARPSDPATAVHNESAGIAALIGRSLAFGRERGQINSLHHETQQLSEQLATLRAPLGRNIRQLLNQGDAIAEQAAQEIDPAKLDLHRQQIEKMAAKFRVLSGPIVPLGEQGLALEATAATLEQWRDATSEQLQAVLGYLLFRLGTLAVAVLALLAVSEVVRRATSRYVRDTRRKRQFVLIRRFVVGIVATLIAVLASVSSLGSFATMAGFVTAGLAVALQNVILSVVAYFFLIGRYGLRTGDRATVSGVTGEVIEVGLVRLYLMEQAGTGSDAHSTGRIAVFSNSIIFQPSALIKQAPGTEYSFHVVTVTLAAEPNLEQARTRILQAVESVYQRYRQVIEQQHQRFEQTANIQLSAPALAARSRYSDSGIEVTVRYPVEIEHMSDTDEQVIMAIHGEIQRDPELKLAAGGYPRIVTAS